MANVNSNTGGYDKYVGKDIIITTEEWQGEFTKGCTYTITSNIYGIPVVVNDGGFESFDILCYENDWCFK